MRFVARQPLALIAVAPVGPLALQRMLRTLCDRERRLAGRSRAPKRPAVSRSAFKILLGLCSTSLEWLESRRGGR